MSITESQVINKVLTDKDYSIIGSNFLEEDNFAQYKNEFNYIKDFYHEYNCVPDKKTFIDKLREFNNEGFLIR